MKGFKKLFYLAMFLSSPAFATTVNANAALYKDVAVAEGININSENELRQAAMLALVSRYRETFGPFSVKYKEEVQIIYQDGSKEKAILVCYTGTPCVQPVPGSKEAAGSNGGAVAGGGSEGGGGNPGSSGGASGSGGGGGFNDCPRCTVTVGW